MRCNGNRWVRVLAIATLAICGLGLSTAQANLLVFNETFDTDTTNRAETEAAYPNLNWTGTGDPVVTDGVVRLPGTVPIVSPLSGFSGDLLVSLKVGNDPGGSSGNMGLASGANRLVFHPGYPTGAFRVEGPNGFGNQNMGFDPAGGGALHQMKVVVKAATGQHIINVIDANNPLNIYTASFTNPGYNPGVDTFGPYRSNFAGYTGTYDDFRIEQLSGTAGYWPEAVQASNPLHWYRLNEFGSTTAVDYGSGGLDGTYQNGADAGQGYIGPQGLGVRFDGADDQISLGGSSISTSWTAEFVLKKMGTESAASLMRSGSGALRLDQWASAGQVGFTEFGVADFVFTPSVFAPTGEFIHLVYVGEPGTGISVYLDGELAATHASFIPLPLGTIGGLDAPNAILDEVVFYNRALSESEIGYHAFVALGVPEPSTVVLLCLGGVFLAGFSRRRRP